MTFDDLDLDERILRAVSEQGFTNPTPIQAEAIPHLMQKRDIIGGARTGSGKTAAFGLPLLHHLRDGGKSPRALILAPTRELARQVSEALSIFSKYLPLEILTIYGGVGYKDQLRALKRGVSVVVGTPGRVIDHIERGSLSLDSIELFVLDEADEMLQMGFIEDIERVLQVMPEGRQVALFSATMPAPIKRVAQKYLHDPVHVQVESKGLNASHITQYWMECEFRQKDETLSRILKTEDRDATLVFARTRASCADVSEKLSSKGFSVDALHGDMSQSARESVLARFRSGRVRVVVATDVAARGLDVNNITHVINYDMPENSETYVHRVGRTARAGREGESITFVTRREKGRLSRLQKDLGQKLERIHPPSDVQIAMSQREVLEKQLVKSADNKHQERAGAWVEDLLGKHDWTIEELASAAVSILAQDQRIDLRPIQDIESAQRVKQEAQKSKGNDRKARKERADRGPKVDRQDVDFNRVNEVELFFPAGRRDGLRPADFVGALCNEAGLSSDQIGRISMGANQAFVGLPRDVAQGLIDSGTPISIRNEQYDLKMSSNKSEESSSSSSSQDRPPRRQNSEKKPYKKSSFKKGGDYKKKGGSDYKKNDGDAKKSEPKKDGDSSDSGNQRRKNKKKAKSKRSSHRKGSSPTRPDPS